MSGQEARSAAYVYANCDVHDGEIEYPDSGCAKCREESEARSAASSYPSAGELLDAIEALLHWRVLATNENQGGLWFYDPEGMGTKPLGPDEIMSMYEKEAKARD